MFSLRGRLNLRWRLAAACIKAGRPIIFTARVRKHRIRLRCSSMTELYRAWTYATKEPETLDWIDSLYPGDTFYDIGANIGVYALYAAKRGLRVFAFEPEALNFAALCTNIQLNNLAPFITAYPIACGRSNKLSLLHLSAFEAGAALHAAGWAIDQNGQNFTPAFVQGTMLLALDTADLLPPHHIKLDVDGLEDEVLAGLGSLLSSVQSIMLEVDVRSTTAEQQLAAAGLSIKQRHVIAAGSTNMLATRLPKHAAVEQVPLPLGMQAAAASL